MEYTLSRLTDFFRRKDSELDVVFYAELYDDLGELGIRELRKHWTAHGKKEGRFPNSANFLASIEAEGVSLESFDPYDYLKANPDLRSMGLGKWAAIEHYVKHGCREGRPTYFFDPNVYRALYFKGGHISDQGLKDHFETIGRQNGAVASAGAYIARKYGLKDFDWCGYIIVDEFAQLNYHWAGQIDDITMALDAMVTEGIQRIAPLSFSSIFDPEFYISFASLTTDISRVEAYKDWLYKGASLGDPTSESSFLKSIKWPSSKLPYEFNAHLYMNSRPHLVNQWRAFADFLQYHGQDFDLYTRSDLDASVFYKDLGKYFSVKNDLLAIRVLKKLELLGSFGKAQTLLLADCYLRQGDHRLALKYYLRIIKNGSLEFFTYCHAARVALQLGKISAAFTILRISKDKVVGAPEWRKVLIEAINSEFARYEKQVKKLIASDTREAANLLTERMIDTVRIRFAEFDPVGIVLPGRSTTKVLILANVDLRQCTHYRVEQKAELFDKMGITYQIFSAHEVDEFISELPGALLAIFYRLPAFPSNIRAIDVATAFGIPTYYDIDDLIFEPDYYPEPIESYGGAVTKDFYQMLQYGAPLFRGAMRMCDFGISSTAYIAEYMRHHVRSGVVFCLPNVTDSRNEIFLAEPIGKSRNNDDIVLFYGSGTKAHNSDFLEMAGPGILEALKDNSRVRFVVAGYLTLSKDFDRYMDRIVFVDLTSDVYSYWSVLAEADINLAVLHKEPTTEGKSEIKWIEAGVFGIASIVSDTHRYKEVVNGGTDALIASNTREWSACIATLVNEPNRRREIGQAAKESITDRHSLTSNVIRFNEIIVSAEKAWSAKSDTSKKKRILLINIFFPPQTLGGSTRVIRDNLDQFLSTDKYEFGIVTTDLGNEGTGRLRVEQYSSCPVFRISTPLRDNMEWWVHDQKTGEIYDRILDIWKPDLIHFHCVQRLTGVIVERTAKRNIPYVTSIHDAWWVSDWHFLSDTKNQLRIPGEAFPLDGPSGSSMGQSIDRQRELRFLLNGSEKIMAVSKAFAQLYQQCGFERTIVVANGVPPLKAVQRSSSVSRRVRLAHVGSTTKFKGFYLVQAVLRSSRFANIELTVVEHNRYGGDIREEIWGDTPVQFVGKTIQENMHEFYANQDVLLAPSLWPEPFGLVAREAQSAGLWVLASDRGAIGEDVTDGVNGWVIDVSTPEALAKALRSIDDCPDKYTRSPPKLPLRQAEEQAADLLVIYAEILSRKRPSRDVLIPRTVRDLRGVARISHLDQRSTLLRPAAKYL